MRSTRTITAIIAFVVTFVFSAGLVRILFGAPETQTVYRYQPPSAERSVSDIEFFIRRDIRNGETRLDKLGCRKEAEALPPDVYFTRFSDAVTEYVNTSSSMDDSSFPQDFQSAWHNHMKAWRDYANFMNDMKDSSTRKKINTEDFEALEDRYTDEIDRTWDEVLRIGRSYGADVD